MKIMSPEIAFFAATNSRFHPSYSNFNQNLIKRRLLITCLSIVDIESNGFLEPFGPEIRFVHDLHWIYLM